jgi:hypothetical protein
MPKSRETPCIKLFKRMFIIFITQFRVAIATNNRALIICPCYSWEMALDVDVYVSFYNTAVLESNAVKIRRTQKQKILSYYTPIEIWTALTPVTYSLQNYNCLASSLPSLLTRPSNRLVIISYFNFESWLLPVCWESTTAGAKTRPPDSCPFVKLRISHGSRCAPEPRPFQIVL